MNKPLKFALAGFTHVGNRASNEDRYCVLSSGDNSAVLLLVADGMGGHAGGALAAQTVIDCANSQWQDHNKGIDPDVFLGALATACHSAVVAAGQAAHLQPRTTLAALYVYVDQHHCKAVSMHVGDSRIMQFSTKGLVNQSLDHSLAQLKVLQGKIKQEDVATDPDQNKVINSIGGDDVPEPEITHWDMQQGDRFVVCSDGFWELFSPEEMAALFAAATASGSDGETLEEIVEQAFLSKLEKAEAQDNTTAVMLSDISVGTAADAARVVPLMPTTQRSNSAAAVAAPGGHNKYSRWAGVLAIVAIAAVVVAVVVTGIAFVGPNDGEQTTAPSGNPADDLPAPIPAGETDNTPGGEPRGDQVPDSPASPTTTPRPTGEGGGTTDGRVLDAVDQEISVVVANDQEMLDAVLEILRVGGGLGADDLLEMSRESQIDDNRVIRLSQEYQGVPVFGGEIVVIQAGDTLTHVSGETGAGITLDVQPMLTFAEAVAQAANSSGEAMTLQGDGQLYIFDSAGTYHLVWIGLVSIDGPPVRMVLDANDAEVLARFPVQIEGNQ